MQSAKGPQCAYDLEPRPPPTGAASETSNIMLSWAFLFLVLAIVASVLGYAGIATAAVDIAKVLFLVFVVLLVVDQVSRLLRKQR